MKNWVFGALLCSLGVARATPTPAPPAAAPPPMRGPAPEELMPRALDLPTVPDFALIPVEAGVHDPFELQINAPTLLDSDVKVRGYVIWAYNCVTAIRKRGESPAQTQRRIDADPTLCERPRIYLGSSKTTSPDEGLWVVDVPRPPGKLEKERLPKEQLDAWPAVPKLAVGDYVVISGKLALESPHKAFNSCGLVVFSSVEHLPAPKLAAAPVPATRTPAAPPAPLPKARTLTPVSAAARGDSIRMANAATELYKHKQYADAAAAYEKAVKLWPDNHMAWYGLGGARANESNWKAARDAMAVAVELAPSEPMYQLFLGRFEYELVAPQVAAGTAKPLTAFVPALAALRLAEQLAPRMWRPHYLLGRIYRDQGHTLDAAIELDQALRAGAPETGPWIALIELYRRWQYRDQALQVARQATTLGLDSTDVWYELGMAFDDLHQDAAAIDAFTKALALSPANPEALFQRGQRYFQSKDYAHAKADLEAFLAVARPKHAFATVQAHTMLTQLAEKHH